MKFVVEKIVECERMSGDEDEDSCYEVNLKFEDGTKESIFWQPKSEKLTNEYIVKRIRKLLQERKRRVQAQRELKYTIEQAKQFVGRKLE